ncbi:hypothetical protein [Nonomuraea sp. NPDC023979]|uniref:hypothetical protein n=1 Tax=Nonomuraea sp. NPDC023979 TaxID=3154796 RepID=UPI0033E3C84B
MFRQFVDGEVLYAADLMQYFVQQVHARKLADETVTSSTTAQNDDHLLVPLLASTKYWIEFFLIYDAAQAGDFKIQWSVPAGATLRWTHGGLGTSTTSTVGEVSRFFRSQSDIGTIGGPAAGGGTLAVVPGEGWLDVGGTPGNLQLQWAQVTSSATGTTLKTNSLLIAQRLTE